MAESSSEKSERTTSKVDQSRERIDEQQRSGSSVRRFSKEQGLAEHSFYAWRKRFREQGAVRFALVERGRVRQQAGETSLELVLASGERLRIGVAVDTATLRSVLDNSAGDPMPKCGGIH